MFDGLDTGLLCCAPFVALFIGAIVYTLGSFFRNRVEGKSNQKDSGVRILITLASIVIVPFACISSLFLNIGSAVPSPWIKPTTSNISGQWVLSKCSSDRFEQRWINMPETPGYIEFRDNKTFEIENLPVLWGLSDPEHKNDGQYVSGAGTWYLEETSGRIGVREWILFAQLNEINREKANRVIGFYFDGHLPPYTLAYKDNINLIHLTKRWINRSYYFCFPFLD
jgi:hypothetical protein